MATIKVEEVKKKITAEEITKEILKGKKDCFIYGLKLLDSQYNRRSFNDFYEHYSKLGATEKVVMKGIKDAELVCFYCITPKRLVFQFPGKKDVPAGMYYNLSVQYTIQNDEAYGMEFNNFGKYTPEYLENLFDSV